MVLKDFYKKCVFPITNSIQNRHVCSLLGSKRPKTGQTICLNFCAPYLKVIKNCVRNFMSYTFLKTITIFINDFFVNLKISGAEHFLITSILPLLPEFFLSYYISVFDGLLRLISCSIQKLLLLYFTWNVKHLAY